MELIKRLLKCVREFKKVSIITPLLVVGESVMEICIPLVMAKMLDLGVKGASLNAVIKYGIILLILVLLSLGLGIAAGYTSAVAGVGFARNLRHDLFCSIQSFSFSNIDKFSTSSLVTRLTTDVTHLQNTYQMALRMLVRAPVMLIFAIIMTFVVNPSLAWIFLCVAPVLGVGLYFILTRAHPIFQRVFKAYDKLNLVVQENLRGIRVVKTFVREDYEREKFKRTSDNIYNWFLKGEKLMVLNMPLMQFCMYALIVLFTWFGSKQIIAGGMSIGDYNSIISYAMTILMSLMMLSMILLFATISRPPAERAVEVLSEAPELHSPENPVSEVKSGSISFKHVSFSYSREAEKPVIDDACLEIRSGQTLGIIGGTGSSKSSFVQLIPRLYDVKSGGVEVGGVDVRDYDLKVLRDSVAMVLQKNVLFSGTIKENLRWGCEDATDEELITACRLAQADGFIREMPNGYDTYIEQGGQNVSGGQKQRLCIARALLKKPKILILDDSTSAVDTHTDALIRQALREHIPDTTKIIIAQRITSVQDADKIIVLEGGKIVACGSHDELMANEDIYRETYYSQNKKEAAL